MLNSDTIIFRTGLFYESYFKLQSNHAGIVDLADVPDGKTTIAWTDIKKGVNGIVNSKTSGIETKITGAELNIKNYPLEDLSKFENLKYLRLFFRSGSKKKIDCSPVLELKNLEHLYIAPPNNRYSKISFKEDHTYDFKELSLWNLNEIEMKNVKFPKLRYLSLINCVDVENVLNSIIQNSELEAVEIYHKNTFNLDELFTIPTLKALSLNGFVDLEEMKKYNNSSLNYLVISGLNSITNLDFIKHFDKLKYVHLAIKQKKMDDSIVEYLESNQMIKKFGFYLTRNVLYNKKFKINPKYDSIRYPYNLDKNELDSKYTANYDCWF